MSASEKLKKLGDGNTDAGVTVGAALMLLDALPQIVAVVEAAEEHVEQDRADAQTVAGALADLDEALT